MPSSRDGCVSRIGVVGKVPPMGEGSWLGAEMQRWVVGGGARDAWFLHCCLLEGGEFELYFVMSDKGRFLKRLCAGGV